MMLVVADLYRPQPERFAVLEVYPDRRAGTGCEARVVSLHMTREEAEAAAAGGFPELEALKDLAFRSSDDEWEDHCGDPNCDICPRRVDRVDANIGDAA